MDELARKVAVVTGAASGLGRAMAERFAQEGMTTVIAVATSPLALASVLVVLTGDRARRKGAALAIGCAQNAESG